MTGELGREFLHKTVLTQEAHDFQVAVTTQKFAFSFTGGPGRDITNEMGGPAAEIKHDPGMDGPTGMA